MLDMSEIKTTNPERLKLFMKENNLEVMNLTQISAILMNLDERLGKLESKKMFD